MNGKPKLYFANLDVLRFLAALWVVITHFGYIGPSKGITGYSVTDGIALTFFKFGYLGVPIFFILSGFVIALVSSKTNGLDDAPQFMANRLSRLMPAFWCCMTVSAIALFVLGTQEPISLTVWAANIILLPQLFGQPFVDGVYWTLVYEFIFYMWAFGLIAFGVFHRHMLKICAIWLAISFANILFFEHRAFEFVFMTYYAGAFIGGLVIWHGRQHGWSLYHMGLISMAMVSLSLGIHHIGTQDHLPNFVASPSLLVTTICSIMCIGVVFLAVHFKDLPIKRSFTLALAAISYPLYLLHQEAGYAILRITSGMGIDPLLSASLLSVFFIVFAYVVHVVLERPLRKSFISLLDILLTFVPKKKTNFSPAE